MGLAALRNNIRNTPSQACCDFEYLRTVLHKDFRVLQNADNLIELRNLSTRHRKQRVRYGSSDLNRFLNRFIGSPFIVGKRKSRLLNRLGEFPNLPQSSAAHIIKFFGTTIIPLIPLRIDVVLKFFGQVLTVHNHVKHRNPERLQAPSSVGIRALQLFPRAQDFLGVIKVSHRVLLSPACLALGDAGPAPAGRPQRGRSGRIAHPLARATGDLSLSSCGPSRQRRLRAVPADTPEGAFRLTGTNRRSRPSTL